MRTEVAIDKLCNIAPILGDLTEKLSRDEKFKAFMGEKGARNNREFLFKFLPHVFKNYREDVYALLAAWNEKGVEEVKAQSFAKTIAEVKEILNDEDFRSFFSSSSASDSVVGE